VIEALPVGAPLRRAIRAALVAAGLCGIACLALSLLTTQDKAVRAHSPWQDDPYDVVVSLCLLFLPTLLAAGALRALSCRADEELPVTRARDLIQLARLVTAAVMVCVVTQWAAVLARWGGPLVTAARAPSAHAAGRDAQGRGLVVALGLVTLLAAVAFLLAARVMRSPGTRGWPRADGPDWIADWFGVAARVAGRRGRAVIAFAERRLVDGAWGVRRHPVAAAAAIAVCCGAAVAASQVVGEHVYPRPVAAAQVMALFTLVGASGTFVFLVAAGHYLRVVAPPPARTPRRAAVLRGTLAAAASVPFTVAFRSAAGGAANGFADLVGLIAVVAAVAGLIALAVRPRCRSTR